MIIIKTANLQSLVIMLEIVCNNSTEIAEVNALVGGFNNLGGIKIAFNNDAVITITAEYTPLNNAIINSVSYALERYAIDKINAVKAYTEHESKV